MSADLTRKPERPARRRWRGAALVAVTAAAPLLIALLVTPSLLAGPGEVALRYGGDTVQYGSCVPTLWAENRTGRPIDYLQVDLRVELADGTSKVLEMKSGYRTGYPPPIAAGGGAALRPNPDESVPLGAPCGAVAGLTVQGIVCDAGGGSCMESVRPAAGAVLPR